MKWRMEAAYSDHFSKCDTSKDFDPMASALNGIHRSVRNPRTKNIVVCIFATCLAIHYENTNLSRSTHRHFTTIRTTRDGNGSAKWLLAKSASRYKRIFAETS